jgi:hypothetical protein
VTEALSMKKLHELLEKQNRVDEVEIYLLSQLDALKKELQV